jgi:acyl-CoA synthetase (AMP-forming)/AMP-acid ligase II
LPEVALEIRAADGNQVPPGGCGRIFTQGPHVMRGYWPPPSQGQSSPVDEAGWWDTGCYGWQDVEGFLWLTLPNQNDG